MVSELKHAALIVFFIDSPILQGSQVLLQHERQCSSTCIKRMPGDDLVCQRMKLCHPVFHLGILIEFVESHIM